MALLRLAVLKLPFSTTTNINKMAATPISQEPIEMQINFMMSSKGYLCARSEIAPVSAVNISPLRHGWNTEVIQRKSSDSLSF